jgi:hypothetical protein
MALTEVDWIRLLSRLSPPDLFVFHDLAASVALYEQTDETTDLHVAIAAFKARLQEKQRIANN